MNPLVSIIIPVYNTSKYLLVCLESIIEQNYTNTEIIIINDGSTDNSDDICQEFYRKYENRIQYITQPNKGVAHSRNIGIMKAKGKYCCFIDSDDYIETNYISTMVQYAERSNADLVCCGCFREIQPSQYEWIRSTEKSKLLTQKEALIELFSPNSFGGWPWNKLFKTSIINDHKILFPSDICYCEDEVFVLEYILNSQNILYIEEVLYHYRVNVESVNLKMISEKKFNYKSLDRIKADNRNFKSVLNIKDKKIIKLFKARLYYSNLITTQKFLNAYNNDYKTLKILTSNLRKYYWYFINSPQYCKSNSKKIGNFLFIINPLLYNKLKETCKRLKS